MQLLFKLHSARCAMFCFWCRFCLEQCFTYYAPLVTANTACYVSWCIPVTVQLVTLQEELRTQSQEAIAALEEQLHHWEDLVAQARDASNAAQVSLLHYCSAAGSLCAAQWCLPVTDIVPVTTCCWQGLTRSACFPLAAPVYLSPCSHCALEVRLCVRIRSEVVLQLRMSQ